MLKMSLRIQYISHGSFLSTIFYSICTHAPALQPYRQGSLVLLDLYKVPHHISPKKKRAAHLPIFCLCDEDFSTIAFKRYLSVLPCHTRCTHHANRQTQLVRKILFFFLALIKDHSSFCGFFFHLLFSFYIKKAGDARLLILRLPACPLLFAKTPPGSNFPFFCTPRFCQKAQISLPS